MQNQQISGAFKLGLVLYIILTGDLSTAIQGIAFGVNGSAGTEFAAAMVSSAARDLLLLAPVMILSRHPLGILHPLLFAVVVWPLAIGMPKAIEEFGGWAGVVAGVPVETPFFYGLPTHDPVTVWTAIAKYNGILILSLVCIYFAFWALASKRSQSRTPRPLINSAALRSVLIGIFVASMLVLLIFLYLRGGLLDHLTALGRGRFRELKNMGLFIVMTDAAAVALYVWIAARPGDSKSPLFLMALAAAMVGQFASNGSRGSVFLVPLIVGLIWAIRRQKIPWKIALLLIPFLFVSIGLLGAVRSASWSGQTAGEAFETTGWAESFVLAREEVAERRAASANVPIIERSASVTGMLFGRSYIAAVVAVVPRSLWPDKPRSAGSLYAQKFLGESSEGAAIPVTPAVEMYWNFGLAGVVLLSILYGGILRFAYLFYWRRYPDPFAIVFYVLILTVFHFGSRQIVRFEQQLGLLLLCYGAAKILVPAALARYVPARFANPARLATQPLPRLAKSLPGS